MSASRLALAFWQWLADHRVRPVRGATISAGGVVYGIENVCDHWPHCECAEVSEHFRAPQNVRVPKFTARTDAGIVNLLRNRLFVGVFDELWRLEQSL